jgi:hypothetical protein
MSNDQRPPLKRIGAAWKGKPGGKALVTGVVSIAGKKQRWMLFRNDKKTEGSSEPDFLLLSNAGPEVDDYAPRSAPAKTQTSRVASDPDDPIPF